MTFVNFYFCRLFSFSHSEVILVKFSDAILIAEKKNTKEKNAVFDSIVKIKVHAQNRSHMEN